MNAGKLSCACTEAVGCPCVHHATVRHPPCAVTMPALRYHRSTGSPVLDYSTTCSCTYALPADQKCFQDGRPVLMFLAFTQATWSAPIYVSHPNLLLPASCALGFGVPCLSCSACTAWPTATAVPLLRAMPEAPGAAHLGANPGAEGGATCRRVAPGAGMYLGKEVLAVYLLQAHILRYEQGAVGGLAQRIAWRSVIV